MGDRPDPGLADHVRSIWRRKLFVAVGLAAGLALGAFALPKAAAAPRYRATVRIDVQPMHAAVLSQSVAKSGGGSPKNAGLEPTSALQDVNVAKTVLGDLGATAPRLSAVKHVRRAEWPGALASSIVPTAVVGSTQWDLAYSDRDAQLAGTVVQRYAEAFAQARNDHDKLLINRGQQKLRDKVEELRAEIDVWALKAQQEASASPRHMPTIGTAGQLDFLRSELKSTDNVLRNAENQLLFLDPSTSVLTPAVVARANQPIAAAIYLLLGLLIGLTGGLGAALVIEAVRPKVVTLEDVARATKLEPVGSVPSAGMLRKAPLAVVERPFSPAAEGYRKVAAELERRGVGGEVKVLAIVSADRREGKSTLAANLAHALASEERNVVVMSGDLRKPNIERIFGIERRRGLADLLQNDGPGNPVGLLWSVTGRLMVLPAGVSERNPAELLATAKLRKVVESLRGFGWLILIDTPPARSLADALSLANCADAVLLVARSGISRAHSLEEVADGLQRVDHRVVGAVLVDASRGAMGRRDLRRSSYSRHTDGFPAIQVPKPLANRSSIGNGTAQAPGNGGFPLHFDQEPRHRPQPHQPQPKAGPPAQPQPQHPQPPQNQSEGLRASSSTDETA
ncbi:MAG TPA: CpsD/CapB family tyrosine-protein kinase [Actinomycetes bacterium]|nr:CpsD/CapB family tyrosine-protein kinase [Actinomycetes bacterium]